MRCKYLHQDLAQRIHGGVCFYNNDVTYVQVLNNKEIGLYEFPLADWGEKLLKTISVDDQLLDISSPELGYANYSNSCKYFMRRPERRYRQTISASCLSVFDPLKNEEINGISSLFNSKAFAEMLMDKYPSVEEAMTKLCKASCKSVAVSKDVALVKDSFGYIRVYFKCDEVGKMRFGDKTVEVPKSENAWVISKFLSDYSWWSVE